MSAVKLIAATDAELYAKLAAAAGVEAVPADSICGTDACKVFALSYSKVLNPKEGNLAEEIKGFLKAHQAEYAEAVRTNVGNFLKNL